MSLVGDEYATVRLHSVEEAMQHEEKTEQAAKRFEEMAQMIREGKIIGATLAYTTKSLKSEMETILVAS